MVNFENLQNATRSVAASKRMGPRLIVDGRVVDALGYMAFELIPLENTEEKNIKGTARRLPGGCIKNGFP